MDHSIFTYLIIGITVWISILGFKDPTFVEKYIFCPEYILADKQYYRLVSSAFLHAEWRHLAFNMFSLYAFGTRMEAVYGPVIFLTIYFASIIGGDLLALWLHRRHVYRAYGASGGVCGVIFASIFLLPGTGVSFFLFPIMIPGWLYATIFLVVEFYGITKGKGNIGHDAHFGGAIIGLLTATAFRPEIVQYSPKLYVTVLLLSFAMLFYLVKNPLFLPITSFVGSKQPVFRSAPKRSVPSKNNTDRVNAILDKISREGMQSLTKEEHEFLLRASKNDK